MKNLAATLCFAARMRYNRIATGRRVQARAARIFRGRELYDLFFGCVRHADALRAGAGVPGLGRGEPPLPGRALCAERGSVRRFPPAGRLEHRAVPPRAHRSHRRHRGGGRRGRLRLAVRAARLRDGAVRFGHGAVLPLRRGRGIVRVCGAVHRRAGRAAAAARRARRGRLSGDRRRARRHRRGPAQRIFRRARHFCLERGVCLRRQRDRVLSDGGARRPRALAARGQYAAAVHGGRRAQQRALGGRAQLCRRVGAISRRRAGGGGPRGGGGGPRAAARRAAGVRAGQGRAARGRAARLPAGGRALPAGGGGGRAVRAVDLRRGMGQLRRGGHRPQHDRVPFRDADAGRLERRAADGRRRRYRRRGRRVRRPGGRVCRRLSRGGHPCGGMCGRGRRVHLQEPAFAGYPRVACGHEAAGRAPRLRGRVLYEGGGGQRPVCRGDRPLAGGSRARRPH